MFSYIPNKMPTPTKPHQTINKSPMGFLNFSKIPYVCCINAAQMVTQIPRKCHKRYTNATQILRTNDIRIHRALPYASGQ